MTVDEKNIPTPENDKKDEGTGVPTIPETPKQEGTQLSQSDIQELLEIKKQHEQNKLQKELYSSVGGKDEFVKMSQSLVGKISEDELSAVNALLSNKDMNVAKSGIAMVKALAAKTQAPTAAEPDLGIPSIGNAAAPIPTEAQKTQTNDENKKVAQATVSNVIGYDNITKPQVKQALDKINDELLDFQDKHYGEDYDLADIMHRKAVDVLDRLVTTAEYQGDKQLAEEALRVYDTIVKAHIVSGTKGDDPIPGRIWENAGDLVKQHNITNRLQGKEKVDFFKETFEVDTATQYTIDNLFKQRAR